MTWYLDHLQNSISSKKTENQETHPKVAATVQKALELWKTGEKVLIFCHYIKTGEILQQGGPSLGCSMYSDHRGKNGVLLQQDVAAEELDFGLRFFDQD